MSVIIFLAGIAIMLLLVMLPDTLKAQTQKSVINRYVEYMDPMNYVNDNPLIGPDALYGIGYSDDAEKYRKEVAPLTKDRFIRRIKMLYGVDITDHYDDKGHCYITPTIAIFPETQLVKIRQGIAVPYERHSGLEQMSTLKKEYKEETDEELTDSLLSNYYRPLSFSDILNYCKWIYYNDSDSYYQIKQGDDNCPILGEYEGKTEVQHIIARHRYAAPFDCRDSLPRDIVIAEFVPKLGVALREDYNYISALNTLGRSRLVNSIAETEFYKLDFDIVDMLVKDYYNERSGVTSVILYRPTKEDVYYISKPSPNSVRYGSYTMGILPSLNRYMTVPRYLSMMSNSVRRFLFERKEEFEQYDYFGHTFLRNLAKGKPIDNSKVGVPYTAQAVRPAVMRVDPYDTGIEFDTLNSGELFTIYEMGYDDFYLAQCAKPVEEWNRWNENGYAMCTGRMERVWCYVPKEDVQILPSEDNLVTPFIEWGIISDAKGSTEIHSNNDEIIGTIPSGEWVKILSYDIRNYLIETKSGIQGRIEKSAVVW